MYRVINLMYNIYSMCAAVIDVEYHHENRFCNKK